MARKRFFKKRRSIRSIIRKELNKTVENKLQQDATGATDVSTTSGTTKHNLHNIASGAGQGQRVGNEIMTKRVQFRIKLVEGTTPPTSPVYVRIMLIYSASPLSTSDYPSVMGSWNKRVGTFTYYDKTFIFNDNNNTGDNQIPLITFNRRVRHKLTFNGTASTDNTKGYIYLYMVQDGASSDNVHYEMTHSLWYTDQ